MKLLERRAQELPLLGVLVVVLAGVGFVLAHHWRVGLVLFGVGLLIGAGLRAVLGDDRIGVLAVRGRTFDVITLAAVGGALVVLAESLSTTT